MAEAHCNECGVSATVVTTLWRCKHCGFMECARCIDQHESKCAGPSSGGDKPTLPSLQGLLDTADRIVACMYPNEHRLHSAMEPKAMSGRDDREAGVTERERQARDKAETAFHDREDAQARAIITLDDARRRIGDLEDELTSFRSRLIRTADGLSNIHWAIWQTIRRHEESSHEQPT